MLLKKDTESLEQWAARSLERIGSICSDAVQLEATDDRVVAELVGIRQALGMIARSLAVLADNSVNPGINVNVTTRPQ